MLPMFRNNCVHRVVSFAGHLLHEARHGPRLNPTAPRGGAVFNLLVAEHGYKTRRYTKAIATLAFALISFGGAAVAQGAPPAKKPTVRGKPIVQAKPSTPMGCKLVGTVKGTKIWAGDCVGASELRGATPAEELSSPPAVAPSEKQ